MRMKTKVLETLALKAKSLELKCNETANEIQTRTRRLVVQGVSENEIVALLSPQVLDLYFHSRQLKSLVEVLKTLDKEIKTDEEAKNLILSLAKETEDDMWNLVKELEKEEEGA